MSPGGGGKIPALDALFTIQEVEVEDTEEVDSIVYEEALLGGWEDCCQNEQASHCLLARLDTRIMTMTVIEDILKAAH